MATFAKKTFNASVYSSFRPTYPKSLFQEVFDYHRDGSKDALWNVAVDLGCGTGQATSQLRGPFRNIIGVDPSKPMIQTARANCRGAPGRFAFHQAQSEDLRKVLKEGTVDLVISAQAAHWFDWERVWPEMSRVLRKGGTAAFWTYAEFRLSNYPTTTPLITAYAQGKEPTTVGYYFERPGRTILENMLTDIPDPTQMESVKKFGGGLGHFERRYFAGPHFPSHLPPPLPGQNRAVQMQSSMRWRDLLGYLRTWSALQNFHERFPEDLERVDDRFPEDTLMGSAPLEEGQGGSESEQTRVDIDVSGGDIAVRFWKDLREEVMKQGGKYGVDEIVSVEWPVALLLAKKM